MGLWVNFKVLNTYRKIGLFNFFEGVKVEQKNTKKRKNNLLYSVVSVECKLAETTEYKCLEVLKR
jgi:hypothetical protein